MTICLAGAKKSYNSISDGTQAVLEFKDCGCWSNQNMPFRKNLRNNFDSFDQLRIKQTAPQDNVRHDFSHLFRKINLVGSHGCRTLMVIAFAIFENIDTELGRSFIPMRYDVLVPSSWLG